MKRVISSEQISLPEENFGGENPVSEPNRRRTRPQRRRAGRSYRSNENQMERPTADRTAAEEGFPLVARTAQRGEKGANDSRRGAPNVVAKIPNCGAESPIYRLGTLRRCGANLSFTAMFLLWSSGLTVGATLCFILVAAGIVPHRLEPRRGADFSPVDGMMAELPQNQPAAAEMKVVHQPADVFSSAASDWNDKALENIPDWNSGEMVVSKPESSFADPLRSPANPELAVKPGDPSIQSAAQSGAKASPSPQWTTIPVEKTPSDIYLGSADGRTPADSPVVPTVPEPTVSAGLSNGFPSGNPAVSQNAPLCDWNQLAAAAGGVSSSKTEVPAMKNEIQRFDPAAAEVAASEDFYRQAYLQGGSPAPGAYSPAPTKESRPSGGVSAPAVGVNGALVNVSSPTGVSAPIAGVSAPHVNVAVPTVNEAVAVSRSTGNNFAGYQIRPNTTATAMQNPSTGNLR